MALRLVRSSSQYLSRTSDILPYDSNYTVMGWWYLASDVNNYQNVFCIANSDSEVDALQMNSDGTTLNIWSSSSSTPNQNQNGTNLSINTWYHLTVVRNGGALTAYLNGIQDCTCTITLGRTAAAGFWLGSWRGAADYGDARFFAFKAWSTSLSVDEIKKEMYVIRPVRASSLHGWWPMFPGSARGMDYSPVGRKWTETGTLTDEAPPNKPLVMWPMSLVVANIAGGTLFNQSVAGALTSAGALGRLPAKVVAGVLSSAGALTKLMNTAKTGTLTSAGALSTVHIFIRALAGTLTSAGTLTKQAGRTLTGALTSAGVLAKQTARALTGTLTSSGALSTIRVILKSLTGILTSAGTLTKQTRQDLTGTLTSAGALTKQIARTLAGALTSSGALSAIRTIFKSLSGTLTSAGALSRQTGKSLAGSISPVGSLSKLIGKAMSSTLSSIGSLIAQLSGLVTLWRRLTLRQKTVRLSLEARSATTSLRARSVSFTLPSWD